MWTRPETSGSANHLKGLNVKRFLSAAALLTMGFLLAGCEPPAPAPKTTAPPVATPPATPPAGEKKEETPPATPAGEEKKEETPAADPAAAPAGEEKKAGE